MSNVSLINGHIDGMTNYDRIRNMSVEEVARYLCEISECEHCFASEMCSFGDNGIKKWLEAEVTE